MSDIVYFSRDADPRAVAPTRGHPTDAGYDLTVLTIDKDYGNGVVRYDTGIRFERVPAGIYFDLVARSSLASLGYMLANGVGIIDNGYRGNLKILLYKFDPNAADLKLPARVAQIIPRQMQTRISFTETVDTPLDTTSRGTGGFGSTNN